MASAGIMTRAALGAATALSLWAHPATAETHSGVWRAIGTTDQEIFRNITGVQKTIVITVCLDRANARNISILKLTDNSLGVNFVLTKDQACHTQASVIATGARFVIRPTTNAETEVTGTYQVSW